MRTFERPAVALTLTMTQAPYCLALITALTYVVVLSRYWDHSVRLSLILLSNSTSLILEHYRSL